MQRLIILRLVAARGVCLCLGHSSTGPGGFPFALCPTSRPLTPQSAFAHLSLAFRCDMFTLQQRVQVEKRARDAAEENIQEELGQCRAALEVGGHWGRGLALLGTSSPCRLGQLQVLSPVAPCSPLAEAGPILRRRGLQGEAGAAAAQPGCAGGCRQAGNQCRGETGGRTSGLTLEAPQWGWEGWRVLWLGLGTHPWARGGLFLLLLVLALTSCWQVPGYKGYARRWEREGDVFAPPWDPQ